jgi:nitrous oxidase accessory protein NosD
VLVSPGTYFENVIVDRKVTLLSEAGAEVTTIDGRMFSDNYFSVLTTTISPIPLG